MHRRLPFLAAALALAAVVSGCVAGGLTKNDLLKLPSLAELQPTSEKGKKCYDFCAQSQMTCKQMCPNSSTGDCIDDCLADTKICLYDCPDLQRMTPVPAN